MMHGRGGFTLEPDEEVLYVTEPDMQSFWMTIGCGAIIGLFFFLIPGLVILLIGFLRREKLKDAECLVTNKRTIVIGWGSNRRVVEFAHHEVASITRSGGFIKSVTIRAHDGRRAKLENVQYGAELIEKVEQAAAASRSTPS